MLTRYIACIQSGVIALSPPCLYDAPRQRADVRAAMAPDLRLIPHPAQRDPLEGPPQHLSAADTRLTADSYCPAVCRLVERKCPGDALCS